MDSQPVASGADQTRALGLSTFAFTVCFAVWTIFSIIGVQIKAELGLTESEFGLLVATPILTGSLSRLILGVWTEKYGGRLVFSAQMILTGLATWALTFADSYEMYLLAALGIGLAGGSFIIGAAYVSRWYPAERQGTAPGVFGAGNVGAAVTKFVAPFVMVAYGWQGVAEVWAAAIALTGVAFLIFAKDDPELKRRRREGVQAPSLAEQFAPLKNLQVWRFSLYYFFVFGAFVALALWTPHYLIDVYGVDVKTAGMMAAVVGVILFLGIKDQPGAFWGFFGCFMALSFLTGVGNASTFQMIPIIMGREIPRLMPGLDPEARRRQADRESAAIIAFTSAIAAYGAFFIPKAYGTSIAMTGAPVAALWAFLVFYAVCLVLTWAFYTRPGGLLHDIERGRGPAAQAPMQA